MVSPNNLNPRRYHFTDKFSTPSVQIGRAPTATDVKDPNTGRYYERPHLWLVGKNPSTGTEGDLWYLADITANSADWRMLSADGGDNVLDLRDQVNAEVGPSAAGLIDIDGSAVANAGNPSAIPLETVADAGNDTLKVQIQVGGAVTGAPGDKNDAGIVSHNDTQFTVNSDGYVSLVGGTDLPSIQTLTSEDPTAVGPDGSGDIALSSEIVANATNTDAPMFIDAGTNALNWELQVTTTVDPGSAPADKFDSGLTSYSSAEFTASIHGFTELVHPYAPVPGAYNIGFALSAGTFTIKGSDGNDLSTTNPGFITIWSREATTPGQLKTIKLTSNVSFDDASAAGGSELTGNLFGTTTGVAYGNDMPFWIKAVLNDDEDAVAFMLTRNGMGLTAPAAANIGAPDDAVADAQNDYWAFDNLDETLYNGNPAMPIGSIYMQKDSSDDWTVQGLHASASGVNFASNFVGFNFSENFVMPASHFGATSGKFFIDGGGTAPTFTTEKVRYQLNGSQTVNMWFHFTGNTATDGSGAQDLTFVAPYTARGVDTNNTFIAGSGQLISPGYTGMVNFEMSNGASTIKMYTAAGAKITNGNLSDGNRSLWGSVIYRTGS